jgi:hypothetical protein
LRRRFDLRGEGIPLNSRPENVKRRKAITAVCGSVVLAAFAALWPLQRAIDRQLRRSPQTEGLLYFTSGRALRRWTLGYDGLMADIYWTRAVQYFGRKRLARATQYPLLGTLLRITTDLDPHLLITYPFGSIFLAEKPPDGAGEPQAALQLIRRGIVANPGYWRLWEDLGFIYYWDLRDYAQAARAFQTGSRQPGADIWMKAMAAAVAAQGGEIGTSRLLWTQIYQTAGTKDVRASALAHLAALDAEQQISQLDKLVELYRHQKGRPPGSLEDLVSAGYLRAIPRDPSGAAYILAHDGRVTIGPGSKVELGLLSEGKGEPQGDP